jgi:hypothetical protein
MKAASLCGGVSTDGLEVDPAATARSGTGSDSLKAGDGRAPRAPWRQKHRPLSQSRRRQVKPGRRIRARQVGTPSSRSTSCSPANNSEGRSRGLAPSVIIETLRSAFCGSAGSRTARPAAGPTLDPRAGGGTPTVAVRPALSPSGRADPCGMMKTTCWIDYGIQTPIEHVAG